MLTRRSRHRRDSPPTPLLFEYAPHSSPPQSVARRDRVDRQLRFERHVARAKKEILAISKRLDSAFMRVENLDDEVYMGESLYRTKVNSCPTSQTRPFACGRATST